MTRPFTQCKNLSLIVYGSERPNLLLSVSQTTLYMYGLREKVTEIFRITYLQTSLYHLLCYWSLYQLSSYRASSSGYHHLCQQKALSPSLLQYPYFLNQIVLEELQRLCLQLQLKEKFILTQSNKHLLLKHFSFHISYSKPYLSRQHWDNSKTDGLAKLAA